MATIDTLLTAAEYQQLPDDGIPTELVRGRVVMMNMPGARHGRVCNRIGRYLGMFVDEHDLGHVLNNDSGVVTQRHPDTVRGADIAFYSYHRLPKDELPDGYPLVAPELVFEVLSPSDRWSEVLTKVAEYLQAGVLNVVVVDLAARTLTVYFPNRPEETLESEDVLTLPDLLPGFSLSIHKLFE